MPVWDARRTLGPLAISLYRAGRYIFKKNKKTSKLYNRFKLKKTDTDVNFYTANLLKFFFYLEVF